MESLKEFYATGLWQESFQTLDSLKHKLYLSWASWNYVEYLRLSPFKYSVEVIDFHAWSVEQGRIWEDQNMWKSVPTLQNLYLEFIHLPGTEN